VYFSELYKSRVKLLSIIEQEQGMEKNINAFKSAHQLLIQLGKRLIIPFNDLIVIHSSEVSMGIREQIVAQKIDLLLLSKEQLSFKMKLTDLSCDVLVLGKSDDIIYE